MAPQSKTAALKRILTSSELAFLMEAHDGLSARIVEEAGFDGVWASGLSMSASLGVRDSNEASWTQVLEVVEFMSDATTIPILLDGDTGYGNFNNMRRLIKKLEQRGVAGVCIEDKQFPKTNSFIDSERQPLADIDEFCGKIKAGKDTQDDPDFCIVARVEALIAGWGIPEALERAEAYRQAGADAVLMHSKKKDAAEIVEFARLWDGRAPLVIVPTTYYATPTEVYEQHNVSTIIWGNHLVRSAITAMTTTARRIQEERSVANVEDLIAPVSEIFRLQGVEELQQAEELYLSERSGARALVLAASRGEELGELTADKPKAMIPIAGKPILARLVEDLRATGIREITVVTGYRADTIDVEGIDVVENPDHATTRDLASLGKALSRDGDDLLVAYGDVLVRRYVVRSLLDSDAPLTIVVDSNVSERVAAGRTGDFVTATAPDTRELFDPNVNLVRFVDSPDESHGQWIGLLRAQGDGAASLRAAYKELAERSDANSLSVSDLLDHIATSGTPVRVMYISGHWLDVNHLTDVGRAMEFTQGSGT